MKYFQHRCLLVAAVAVIVAGSVGASAVLAEAYDPFPQMVKDLGNVTAGNHQNQLSTIADPIERSPGQLGSGIHLDVNYRIGNTSGCDPDFGCGPGDVVGDTFARVSVGTTYPPNYTGPGDLSGYTGVRWTVMSDVDLFVQPWVKVTGNYVYWEPNGGGFPVPGDMQNHHIVLDFANAVNYAGIMPSPGQIQGLDQTVEWGLQLGYNGPALDPLNLDGVDASIWITSWVPEPSSFALLSLGMAGFAGFARRRHS